MVPFVEGKYATYAASTSAADLKASRMHRAYGGFSMGSVSTWAVFEHCVDIVGYFLPMSGAHHWGTANPDVNALARAVDNAGLKPNQYFMRIEQRIGRIDRRGQLSDVVNIYNIITEGTVDAEIYHRCLMRI